MNVDLVVKTALDRAQKALNDATKISEERAIDNAALRKRVEELEEKAHGLDVGIAHAEARAEAAEKRVEELERIGEYHRDDAKHWRERALAAEAKLERALAVLRDVSRVPFKHSQIVGTCHCPICGMIDDEPCTPDCALKEEAAAVLIGGAR